jgi:hypothetical protein
MAGSYPPARCCFSPHPASLHPAPHAFLSPVVFCSRNEVLRPLLPLYHSLRGSYLCPADLPKSVSIPYPPFIPTFSDLCTDGTWLSVHLLSSRGLVARVFVHFPSICSIINSHYPIAPYFLVRIALSTFIVSLLHSPLLT